MEYRPRRKKLWTPENLAKLRELWDAGATCQAIADHFGLTWRSIARARERYDLPARRGLYCIYEPEQSERRGAVLPPQRPGWPTRDQLMAGR